MKRGGLLLIIFALTMAAASCGVSPDKSSEPSETEISSNDEAVVFEDVSYIDCDLNDTASCLALLRDGNTKPLVGFAFGDELDYDAFDVGGYGRTFIYQLKESENSGLFYSFENNRFSGFGVYSGGDFFGIKPFEDTFYKLSSVLGEPDVYEKDEKDLDNGYYAEYYLEKVTLYVHIRNDGMIQFITCKANEVYSVSDTPSDYDIDASSGDKNIETIFVWGIGQESDWGSSETWEKLTKEAAYYHPYDESYDENKKLIFIKNYLQERGLFKEKPDGVTYDQDGMPLAEYYTDKDKICFIIHLWGNYWLDYDAGKSFYTDAVYCTTLYYDEAEKAGSILYDYDAALGVTNENLYDAHGRRMASVSYENIQGIPFITEYWNINTWYDLIRDALCRNQKTWFYKEQAVFDEQGKLIGYGGNINEYDYKTYLPYPCRCVYGEDGRLEAIEEELQEYDIEQEWGWWDESIDYSGQIKFSYHENGNISAVDYFRSSYSHGTTDSSGEIYYDEKGRMISNSYYITHGGHVNIFLYEGDSTRPWASFYWCSYENGFERIYLYK